MIKPRGGNSPHYMCYHSSRASEGGAETPLRIRANLFYTISDISRIAERRGDYLLTPARFRVYGRSSFPALCLFPLLSHRRGEGVLDAPSIVVHSVTCYIWRDAVHPAPLCEGLGMSIDGVHLPRGPVVRLRLAGHPAAIPGPVSLVVVHPVDSQTIPVSMGHRPLVEYLEVFPLLAHPYSDCAVMRIVFGAGIRRPFLDPSPYVPQSQIILRGFVHFHHHPYSHLHHMLPSSVCRLPTPHILNRRSGRRSPTSYHLLRLRICP